MSANAPRRPAGKTDWQKVRGRLDKLAAGDAAGLTPERARAVLRAGRSLADAAAAAGFADQSHLGRSFRAVMGSTPG